MEETEGRPAAERIAEAVRERNMTTERLAQLTGVSDRYIELLLGGKLKELPAAPYVRGYILRIADALDLPGEELWRDFSKQDRQVRRTGYADALPLNRFASRRTAARIIIGGAVAVIILAFIIIRLVAVNRPRLNLEGLKGEITIVKNNGITLKGTVDPSDKVLINDEEAFVNEDGTFEKQAALEPGFNTFVFTVKKVLGKPRTVTKQVFLETPAVRLTREAGAPADPAEVATPHPTGGSPASAPREEQVPALSPTVQPAQSPAGQTVE